LEKVKESRLETFEQREDLNPYKFAPDQTLKEILNETEKNKLPVLQVF